MRIISLFVKVIFFWILFSIPLLVPSIIFGLKKWSLLSFLWTPLFILGDHLSSYKVMNYYLNAKTEILFGKSFQVFTHGKPAILVSQHVFQKETTFWIHQQYLDHFDEEEIKSVLLKVKKNMNRNELLFETYLTLWIHRFSKGIHRRFPLWSLFCIGFIFLFSKFLNKNELIRSVNEDEKNRIRKFYFYSTEETMIPPAFQNLSLFPFHQKSILDYGRSCLWKKEELKLF